MRGMENDRSQPHVSEGGKDDNPSEIASLNDREIQATFTDPSAIDKQPLHDQQNCR